ncbi:hypothetical protein HPB47_011102, partial [Ixodes persulcatus]
NPSLSDEGHWERIYWPVHTAYGKEYLTLAVNSSLVGYGHRANYCAFWQQFLPRLVNLSANHPNMSATCTAGASQSVPVRTAFLSLPTLVSFVAAAKALLFYPRLWC